MRKIFGIAIITLLLLQVFVFVFALFNRQNIFSPAKPEVRVGRLPEVSELVVSEGSQSFSDVITKDMHQDFIEQVETFPLAEDLPES